jgi:hypothetical protein
MFVNWLPNWEFSARICIGPEALDLRRQWITSIEKTEAQVPGCARLSLYFNRLASGQRDNL